MRSSIRACVCPRNNSFWTCSEKLLQKAEVAGEGVAGNGRVKGTMKSLIKTDENGWPVDRDALIGREFVHFKGNRYRLVDFALDSETQALVVVYRALYGTHGLWVRPAKMFFEDVEIDGVRRPRFVCLG